MYIQDGKIILEKKKCWNCQEGKVCGYKPCTKCNGTMRRGRGKCSKCSNNYGIIPNGKEVDWDNPQTCPKCNGDYQNREPEILTDSLPKEEFAKIPVRVAYYDRPITLNESLLGLGCLYSCEDYGRAWKTRDENTLIEEVKNHSHQACKVANKNCEVCKYVEIAVNNGGYGVRAIF